MKKLELREKLNILDDFLDRFEEEGICPEFASEHVALCGAPDNEREFEYHIKLIFNAGRFFEKLSRLDQSHTISDIEDLKESILDG